MKISVYIERIVRIDQLVRMEATGPPKVLARRLRVSRSTLLALIKYLKEELNFPIDYCRKRNSYYYSGLGQFKFGFEKFRIDQEESAQIKGGYQDFRARLTSNFFSPFSELNFLRR